MLFIVAGGEFKLFPKFSRPHCEIRGNSGGGAADGRTQRTDPQYIFKWTELIHVSLSRVVITIAVRWKI